MIFTVMDTGLEQTRCYEANYPGKKDLLTDFQVVIK